jgi:hypothetical protein
LWPAIAVHCWSPNFDGETVTKHVPEGFCPAYRKTYSIFQQSFG